MTILYLPIIFLLASRGSDGHITFPSEDQCLTPSKHSGHCINVKMCLPLLNLLMQPRPWPTSTLTMLRESQCGFDGRTPKVCCPRDITVSTTESVPTSTTVVSAPDVTNHPNLRFLDDHLCGPITEPRIVGGNVTKVTEFPWMALINYEVGRNRVKEFKCGGSLISKRYVLTAAHCVTDLSSGLRLYGVRVGDHDLGKERDCDRGEKGLEEVCAERYQDFMIEQFHYHPDYQRSRLQNDIALIRINADADMRPKNVRPICLPIGSGAMLRHNKVIVTGWGTTENGYRSQVLLKVKLPIAPHDECAKVYKNQGVTIWYKQLCAGGSNRMDSCSGDSGGPLQSPEIYYNNQPRYIQFGVVSFGPKNCGIEGLPGVYTQVSYYMGWILDTMTE